VFDAFYQGAQPKHRPQGGLGLGLSLVRRLAELHGGEAWADSEGEGRGACFTVALPGAAAPAVTAPTVARTAGAVPRRVLVVEDNEDGRETLRQVLTLAGHEVRVADGGEAALALVGAWRPDVALVDIGLPDIDGHELARRLRGLGLQPPPRLIAMSGFGQPQDKALALSAGFERHLTKPVDPAQLFELLEAPLTQALETGT
jgi:CheY-like chemotaxis protein